MRTIRAASVLGILFCSVACAPMTPHEEQGDSRPEPVGQSSSALTGNVTDQIVVDAIGYRPNAPRKVALFADPEVGFNASVQYTPGATFQVRNRGNDAIVYTGSLAPWKNGAVDTASGDRVWIADFSSVTAPGTYYIYDPTNNTRTSHFTIYDGIYSSMLRHATRAFYGQRCGQEVFAWSWYHDVCHSLDHAAPLRQGGASQGNPRDVSGGWHDAGDYNKYVTFAAETLWDLMMAYEMNPSHFGDSTGIPESGNGVADLVDEIKWELDWLLKMQLADGSVANRVAVMSYDDGDRPDDDTQPRYYTPATTWATAAFAGVAARGARVFQGLGGAYPGYAALLQSKAIQAWSYLSANPSMLPASGQDGAGSMAAASAGADANQDKRLRVLAAAELFALTGGASYKSYFDAGFNDISGTADDSSHPRTSEFVAPGTAPELTRAYVVYARTPGATSSIAAEIRTLFANFMDWISAPAYLNKTDPYRAYMWTGHYSWGSNKAKAEWGTMPLFAIHLGVAPQKHALYREIAEEYVHYLHGRNPLSQAYLTNLQWGADMDGVRKSVMHIHHAWFEGTPPPGFLVGGPNQYFAEDSDPAHAAFLATLTPPAGQPPMKAYRDWNTVWNDAAGQTEDPWKVNEPAINYQASYVLLLSWFATPAAP